MAGKIAEAATALRIATRKACTGKENGHKKSTMSLETKVLFLIKDMPRTPNNLTEMLMLQKSNLATLASRMENAGLMTRKKVDGKRDTAYHITDAGRAFLDEKLEIIEESFKKFLTSEKEYDEAVETLSKAERLLSFI